MLETCSWRLDDECKVSLMLLLLLLLLMMMMIMTTTTMMRMLSVDDSTARDIRLPSRSRTPRLPRPRRCRRSPSLTLPTYSTLNKTGKYWHGQYAVTAEHPLRTAQPATESISFCEITDHGTWWLFAYLSEHIQYFSNKINHFFLLLRPRDYNCQRPINSAFQQKKHPLLFSSITSSEIIRFAQNYQ